MKSLWKGLGLVLLALALMVNGSGKALAQVPTTTVQDTVYRADGTPAGGQVIVSWNAFTTAGGTAVPAGSTTATIGAGGALSIALTPNAGSNPMGSYYTVVYHLNDGTTSREYWVVPVAVPGGSAVKLAAIRNQVLPASVAMQTVSKQYVDNAIAAAAFGFPLDGSPYVEKAGDTMTGPLVLPADPATPNQAADKNYVDANVASVAGGLAGKVALLPSATQVVTQPTGTQLETNILNGELYATQYLDNSGLNGIPNALASAECTNGCKLILEPTFPDTHEQLSTYPTPQRTHEVDKRGAAEYHMMRDPYSPSGNGGVVGEVFESISTRSPQDLIPLVGAVSTFGAGAMNLQEDALAGGSNQYPIGIEAPPYFKSSYGVQTLDGEYHTEGQHIVSGSNGNCYSVGDCISMSNFLVSSGGYRDPSDEGTHFSDEIVQEDTRVFTGICSSGCTTGSTSLMLTGLGNAGTQGDGRYLIDTNPAKAITAGTLTGGDRTIFGSATFSGTSFPVSVFLTTAAAATSQPTNMAPGSVTLPIATSGVTSGFATNTAALPATTGIACMADPVPIAGATPNFETAPYSVVDGTHLQLTLNKVHASGATIAVGGLCGYGLEETVDTVGAIRQVFPVVGSTSATSLYYADGGTPVVGRSGFTSGYLNVQLPVASIARSGNVVTLTMAGTPAQDLNGLTLTVSGVADSSYNGSYVVTSTAANVLTYANSGPDSTSSGGSIGTVTGGFGLYPMAEVLSVYNTATKQVDGLMTLAPNTVAWAAGDSVEEPHYYQQINYGDLGLVTQTVPRVVTFVSSGRTYGGTVGPGLRGWTVKNEAPSNQYYGGGGTHGVPDAAYVATGPWDRTLDIDAGVTAVMNIHCNLHGCNKWNSGYSLFLLQAASGLDSLTYSPQSSTAAWNVGGAQYSFSPTAFTAGTINVGTLNATTIAGGVSAGAITSGTISPARLPVFGPSGTTHAVGAVPDPGATAGNTRYLREDGTWDVPSSSGGGGGSPSGAAGGDLAGTYPNPVVAAVHATAGTLDGVTIGGSTPAAGSFTSVTTGAMALSNVGLVAGSGFGTLYFQGNAALLDAFAVAGTNRVGGLHLNPDNAGFTGNTLDLSGYNGFTAEKVVVVTNKASGTHATLALTPNGGEVSIGAGVGSGTSTNTDLVGTLALSAGSTTSASYAFTGTYASAPVCLVQPQSATPGVVAG